MPEDFPIREHKAEFARRAVTKHNVASFADLGGCWGVHAGYAIDLLKSAPFEHAYVLDGVITDLSVERGAKFPQLKFIRGMLGDPSVIERLPQVDALLMFDILLHQVDPDWDRFIDLWSRKTRAIIIYNQMWVGPETVRFIDRGLDWYLRNVFYRDAEQIRQWFARFDEIDERSGRKRRDVHNYWQFGITRADLIGHVERLGFRLDCFENFGTFGKHRHIQNEGFVFVKQ